MERKPNDSHDVHETIMNEYEKVEKDDHNDDGVDVDEEEEEEAGTLTDSQMIGCILLTQEDDDPKEEQENNGDQDEKEEVEKKNAKNKQHTYTDEILTLRDGKSQNERIQKGGNKGTLSDNESDSTANSTMLKSNKEHWNTNESSSLSRGRNINQYEEEEKEEKEEKGKKQPEQQIIEEEEEANVDVDLNSQPINDIFSQMSMSQDLIYFHSSTVENANMKKMENAPSASVVCKTPGNTVIQSSSSKLNMTTTTPSPKLNKSNTNHTTSSNEDVDSPQTRTKGTTNFLSKSILSQIEDPSSSSPSMKRIDSLKPISSSTFGKTTLLHLKSPQKRIIDFTNNNSNNDNDTNGIIEEEEEEEEGVEEGVVGMHSQLSTIDLLNSQSLLLMSQDSIAGLNLKRLDSIASVKSSSSSSSPPPLKSKGCSKKLDIPPKPENPKDKKSDEKHLNQSDLGQARLSTKDDTQKHNTKNSTTSSLPAVHETMKQEEEKEEEEKKVSKKEEKEEQNVIVEEDLELNSQPILETEDQRICDLDRSGALKEVIGSQSTLSQEIMEMNSSASSNEYLRQTNRLSNRDPNNNDDNMNQKEMTLLDAANSKSNLNTINSAEHPTTGPTILEEMEDEDVEDLNQSQPLILETEEQHIQNLDRSGVLTQIVGSQSTLSQEIIEMNSNASDPQNITLLNPSLPSSLSSSGGGDSLHKILTPEINVAKDRQQQKSNAYECDLDKAQQVPSGNINLKRKRKDEGEYTSTSNTLENEKEIELKRTSSLIANCGIIIEAAQIIESQERKRRQAEQNPLSRSNSISQKLFCEESMDESIKKAPSTTSTTLPSRTSVSNKKLSNTKTSSPTTSSPTTFAPFQMKSSTIISPNSSSPTSPKPPQQQQQQQQQQQAEPQRPRRKRAPPSASVLATAKAAASLSRSILNNPATSKQLLLRMALVRENPRHPRKDPPRGAIIPHGFFWGSFPSLENILRTHMKEYYDLSTNKRQSRAQQEFNNKLVTLVRQEAKSKGWAFDSKEFDDRKIRDRIRCFFKTHIQNSKKRLRTMLKNPTKRANAKALVKHMDLMGKDEGDGVNIAINDENASKDDEKQKTKRQETNNTSKDEKTSNDSGNDADLMDTDDPQEEYAQDPNKIVLDDHDAAQQVLALGFVKLSQDPEVGTRA